jgi:hypothetical protein
MDKTRMVLRPPLGPGFTFDEAEHAHAMSITCSSFKDTGEDWTEFVLLTENGAELNSIRVKGY